MSQVTAHEHSTHLGVAAEALPGQLAFQQIDEDVAQRLQIVAARLLDARVRVDGGVARRARQLLVVPVRHVPLRRPVKVLFGQPKVNHVHCAAALAQSHQEVFRLE